MDQSEFGIKTEFESSVPESIRRTNPSYKNSLFEKKKKTYKTQKFDKPIVARKAFKSNNNKPYDIFQ